MQHGKASSLRVREEFPRCELQDRSVESLFKKDIFDLKGGLAGVIDSQHSCKASRGQFRLPICCIVEIPNRNTAATKLLAGARRHTPPVVHGEK